MRDGWVGLWLCLSCGWVACSDDSPNQHAKAHYQETDHPSPSRWSTSLASVGVMSINAPSDGACPLNGHFRVPGVV